MRLAIRAGNLNITGLYRKIKILRPRHQTTAQSGVGKSDRFRRRSQRSHIPVQTEIIEINKARYNQQQRQNSQQHKPGYQAPQRKLRPIQR